MVTAVRCSSTAPDAWHVHQMDARAQRERVLGSGMILRRSVPSGLIGLEHLPG